MKKYSFLVFYKEYLSFLNELQELGVVHVIEKKSGEIEDDTLREKFQLIQQLSNTINFLQKRVKEPSVEKSDTDDGLLVLEKIRKLHAENDQILQKLAVLKKEKAMLEPWGEINREQIDALKSAGLHTRFFSCAAKKFEGDWKNNFTIEQIYQSRSLIYFVLFESGTEKAEIDAEEIYLPERSLHSINIEIGINEEKFSINETLLDNYAATSMDSLLKSRNKITGELSFDKVILNTQKEADNKLMVLEGWVPKDSMEKLEKYLSEKSIYYQISESENSEPVPIKLKNNFFSRLFEPIGELYSLPQYNELDLTPFFAPFFMLFFGFCLGDIGYGLLILAATFYYKPKVKPKIKPILTLAQFLGISTILMGIVSGTFFGINLLETDFLFFPSLRFMMLDSEGLMKLSLIIGAIQIIFGISLKAARTIIFEGWRAAFSTIGWLFVIIFSGAIYFLAEKGIIPKEHSLNLILIICAIGSFPILLFNTPKRNIFINFGAGLWDTYGMVSGLLGDLLSYIRLFALGISSAVLGLVFNQIAVELSGNIPVVSQIIMILILLFGHSLNLGLSALGSFVHPMRLTFVEFYKNSGFNGGGLKYKPFSK